MEVVVMLEDRTSLGLTNELSSRFGRSLATTREGAVNPDAPACSTQFGTNNYGESLSLPNCSNISPDVIGFILPHELLKGTRLKKK